MPFISAVMLNELLHWKGYFKITTYLPVIIPSIATCLIWKMVYMDGQGECLTCCSIILEYRLRIGFRIRA